jgi:hypothetical protein
VGATEERRQRSMIDPVEEARQIVERAAGTNPLLSEAALCRRIANEIRSWEPLGPTDPLLLAQALCEEAQAHLKRAEEKRKQNRV